MTRPLRIEFPGALYHVMSRGNERRRIVRDDADRQKWIEWLRRTVETHGWRLHGFVLMPNHHHLFVETPEANLSEGMHYLNGSFTGYFNRRHRRSGHLFQGRFKAHLVEEEGYFLEVSRYVHLNPVRGRLVERPEDYRWSSYPGYRRAARALPWVTYARVLGEFGHTASQTRRAYARFVQAGIDEPPESPFRQALGGFLLGSSEFIESIGRRLEDRPTDADVPQLQELRPRPSLATILTAVGEHFDRDPADWSRGTRCEDAGRAVAAYLARRRFGYRATAVAVALGYGSSSAVSHAIRRIDNGPAQLRRTVERISKALQ